MFHRRTLRGRVATVVAAVTCLTVPAALAGAEPVPLGVDSGADQIFRAGYHLERQTSEAGTVTVRVLFGETVRGSATGKATAPARNAREMEAPCRVRTLQADPVVAVIDSERKPVNTP